MVIGTAWWDVDFWQRAVLKKRSLLSPQNSQDLWNVQGIILWWTQLFIQRGWCDRQTKGVVERKSTTGVGPQKVVGRDDVVV